MNALILGTVFTRRSWLAAIRAEKGYTQMSLAIKLGDTLKLMEASRDAKAVSVSSVAAWEAGIKLPSEDHRVALALVLGDEVTEGFIAEERSKVAIARARLVAA